MIFPRVEINMSKSTEAIIVLHFLKNMFFIIPMVAIKYSCPIRLEKVSFRRNGQPDGHG